MKQPRDIHILLSELSLCIKDFLFLYTWYCPVTIAHMCVIFRVHFYSVSKVQIHGWFRPTATRGSQRGYKYDHMRVAKAARVVLMTTGMAQ